MFSMMTGYVCGLKPIRQANAGHHEAALITIAKSAFRRPPRIIIPATIATVISWFLCQLGGTNAANDSESHWMRYTTQGRGNGVFDALYWLLSHWINTWTTGINGYDPHQWNLLPLIRASMNVYITLAGCIYMRPKSRMITYGILWFYCFLVNDGKFYLPL